MNALHRTSFIELLVSLPLLAVAAALLLPAIPSALVNDADDPAIELENRAKLTLRALGSCQLAYQDQNRSRNYGSYANLYMHDFIHRDYTRATLVPSYSLAVFYASQAVLSNGHPVTPSTFTIVAQPTDLARKLRTFSICDDQIVRVATDFHLNIIPNHNNNHPTGADPCLWEPVRKAPAPTAATPAPTPTSADAPESP